MSSVAIPLTVITNLDIRNNFSIFAIANEYAMTTKLINIGNSRGVVIPAKLLKKYKVDDNGSSSSLLQRKSPTPARSPVRSRRWLHLRTWKTPGEGKTP